MEPNMNITLTVSRFAADTPHETVVSVFRQIERAANEIATGYGLECLASWTPVPDRLELDDEPDESESRQRARTLIDERRTMLRLAEELGVDLPRPDAHYAAELRAAADLLAAPLPRRRARCSS